MAAGTASLASPTKRFGHARTSSPPVVPDYEVLKRIGPGAYGDVWLGCRLWDELQLEEFWRQHLPGNTNDRTTLKGFLQRIQTQYGQARRIWVLDRGIPTEETLQEMRQSEPTCGIPGRHA